MFSRVCLVSSNVIPSGFCLRNRATPRGGGSAGAREKEKRSLPKTKTYPQDEGKKKNADAGASAECSAGVSKTLRSVFSHPALL